MLASFQISTLATEQLQTLFALDEDAPARFGAKRIAADANPGYPCRVSLEDAEIGEAVILLPYNAKPGCYSCRVDRAA